MKKFIVMTLLLVMALTLLSSCNYQMLDTNYTFDRAIIEIGGQAIEVEVKAWRDYENSDQVQIVATDGTVYLTHTSRCVLITDSERSENDE